MNKYLKFEYWNTCDLGNIYYQGGQHFIFYLDADVGEPIHEQKKYIRIYCHSENAKELS